MKNLGIAGFYAVALAISGNAFAQTNLLTNGSFENGIFVPNSQATMSLTVGATALSSWTVGNASLAWIGSANPFGLSASNGGKFLDLSDYRDRLPYSSVSQTINTVAGYQYVLSFDMAGSGNAPAIRATAGSTSSTFVLPRQQLGWTNQTLAFTGNGSPIAITFAGATGYNTGYVGLDNATLTIAAVPEPAEWAMLIAGLGLIGLIARRRNKA